MRYLDYLSFKMSKCQLKKKKKEKKKKAFSKSSFRHATLLHRTLGGQLRQLAQELNKRM